MNVLLAYAAKHGTTAMCIERLRNELPSGLTVKIAKLEDEQPDPSNFDAVVFGSAVYFGKLRPAAKAYLQRYESTLCERPLGLFLVCGLAHEYEYYRDKLLPISLRENAFATVCFGGSLSTKGLSVWEWLLVRAMRSHLFEEDIDNGEYTPTLPGILPENIAYLGTHLRAALDRLSGEH